MTADADQQLRAVVHGRVQGVGFRAFAARRAGELRLTGYARNLSDGVSVEVIAEGPRAALDALLAALRIGHSGAYVEKVDASWSAASGTYRGFGAG